MMRKIAWILLLGAGHMAHAQSFDCTKAKTPQEKAICSSKELSAADTRMAATYRAVLAVDGAAEIREDQRRWARGMEATCGGNLPADAMTERLIKYYRARTQALQHMVAPEYHMTSRSLTLDEHHLSEPDRIGPPRTGNSVEGSVILVPDTRGNDRGWLKDAWPEPLPPDWKAWHQALQAAAREWAVQGVSDWRKDADVLEDMHLGIEIGPVSDWLVTASIRRYWKLPGPHGDLWGDHSLEFNWLVKENRELKGEDIFRAGSGWDKELLMRWDSSLRKQLNNYDSAAYLPALKEIAATSNRWHFENDSLAVFEVKGIALLDPLRVKWDDLRPFLRQDHTITK